MELQHGVVFAIMHTWIHICVCKVVRVMYSFILKPLRYYHLKVGESATPLAWDPMLFCRGLQPAKGLQGPAVKEQRHYGRIRSQ